MDFQIREYEDEKGRSPFKLWIESLRKDKVAQARILNRVRRFEQGNLGDAKSVGSGVIEHRMKFGPGYRVYYGRHGSTLVILLGGGDKATQARDIRAAIKCFERWKNENESKT